MEHTDSFTRKFILVSKDEQSAKAINHAFVNAGQIQMDVETGINNVIPKLNKDSSYECIVLESGSTPSLPMYISKLRANRVGAQVPIVVLYPDVERWLEVTQLYDAGANFVVTTPLDVDTANHICWLVESLIRFVMQYKENLERFYRR